MSSTYPLVSLGGVSTLDKTASRFALDPSTPPRATPMPDIVNLRIPGRTGSVWTASTTFPAPMFTVVILVAGAGPTTDARYADMEAIVEGWATVVAAQKVTIDYAVSATKVRHAEGRCVSFDVDRPALDYCRITIVLEIVDSFWRGETVVRLSPFLMTGIARNGLVKLPVSFSGTAPIMDAIIKVVGPVHAPVIYSQSSDDEIRYPGWVATNQSMIVDTRTMVASVGKQNIQAPMNPRNRGCTPITVTMNSTSGVTAGFRLGTLGSPFNPTSWLIGLGLRGTSIDRRTRLRVAARTSWL